MADMKLTELNAVVSANEDDVFYIVTDPSGTPMDKKITLSNLVDSVLAVGGDGVSETDQTKLDNISITQPVDLDKLSYISVTGSVDLDANKTKLDYMSVTKSVNLDKLDFISVTQAIDLDNLESGGGGGGEGVDIVASGTLDNGAVVVLNSDGTVSMVSSAAGDGAGTPVIFESANTQHIAATFDSDSNKVVIAYQDAGNSYYGTAIVGTVSGTSISFGTPGVFESANVQHISATFDSSNNKVVIVYRDADNSGYGTAVVGTISGTSISFGTPVVFESASISASAITFDSDSDKIVIAYRDDGNSYYGTAVVGTVSGTSISFGTPVIFESASTAYISATFDSSNNKVVIVYADGGNSDYGTAIVGTVSGTSISFGTAVVFESAAVSFISVTFDSSNNKIVIAYRDSGNSYYGTTVVGTISGTSISFGTATVFESANTAYISATFDSNSNKIVIAYMDSDNSGYGTTIVGTVSGTSMSFGTATVFESASISASAITFDSSNNKIVIAYRDDGNSYYGTSVIYGTESTNAEDWFGISSTAYTDGQTATIFKLGDVVDNQTGLMIDSAYYVDTDGSLTADVTDLGKIGRAISATELLITEGNV